MEDDEEYLISYANLKSRLFDHQKKFVNSIEIEKFYKKPFYGIPQLLPKNIRYFDYSKAIFFKINKKKFSKKIFNTDNLNYIGNKKIFRYGNEFASNVFLKKKYEKRLNWYKKNIEEVRRSIKNLNKSKKKICAMQIRNAPHFGHEAVFRFILKKFDYLVLNPIFGIKKKKDFSDLFIKKALNFMQKKYTNIKFFPIYSNFYYGGPREALHHLIIRKNLGFQCFYIGRDHAGAENLYNNLSAIKVAKKYKNKFSIKILTSKGGYYCKICDKYLIKDSCRHKKLTNVSGTEFRKCLNRKFLYVHADKKLQEILSNIND